MTNKTPTEDMYLFIQYAYKYFNQKLFNDQLPPCLITLQRENNTLGYFHPKRFINSENKNITDEIALNPCFFAARPMAESLSTLVHEQVHLWQFHYGNPGRRGYHNREWGKNERNRLVSKQHRTSRRKRNRGKNVALYCF